MPRHFPEYALIDVPGLPLHVVDVLAVFPDCAIVAPVDETHAYPSPLPLPWEVIAAVADFPEDLEPETLRRESRTATGRSSSRPSRRQRP